MERRAPGLRPSPVSVAVLVAGVAITAALAAASSRAHEDNEDRLLAQRTREAAAVLEGSVPGVEAPLATSAGLAEVFAAAQPALLDATLGTQVGPDARFTSASIWPVEGSSPRVVVGTPPLLAERDAADVAAFLERATSNDGMTVMDLLDGDAPRLGYAYTVEGPQPRFIVYAEQALPARRTAVVQPDAAFDGLDYSLHLGPEERTETLLAASTDELPLAGRRAAEEVPFGDTSIRLVMTPTEDLGGALLARLPAVTLGAGALTSLGAAALTERLQRKRRVAEVLAADNARLYAVQRDGSLLLQHSLLPSALPTVPGLQIEVRYAAGEVGTEVGGDWYDVVEVDDALIVVVGDVSGRGLGAASVMASVRYTMRALATQGLGPADLLARTGSALDDGGPVSSFATAVCGEIRLADGSVTFADAGHPRPLLVAEGTATWVDVPVGPPIGVRSSAPYEGRTVAVAPGTTLLLFTDGLFERRGEPIDVSLERVRRTATELDGPLDTVVDQLLERLTAGHAADDTAILAIRWEP